MHHDIRATRAAVATIGSLWLLHASRKSTQKGQRDSSDFIAYPIRLRDRVRLPVGPGELGVRFGEVYQGPMGQ